MTNSREIMCSKDAACFIALSESTLAKMRLTGGGPPYIKTKRRVFYLRSDLMEWLQERRVTSTSEYLQE